MKNPNKITRTEAEIRVEDFLEDLETAGWRLSTNNDPRTFRLQPRPSRGPRPGPDPNT